MQTARLTHFAVLIGAQFDAHLQLSVVQPAVQYDVLQLEQRSVQALAQLADVGQLAAALGQLGAQRRHRLQGVHHIGDVRVDGGGSQLNLGGGFYLNKINIKLISYGFLLC